MRHAIRCPHCWQAFEFPFGSAGDVACPGCKERIIDLGPIPIPNWRVLMASAINGPRVPTPEPMKADAIPKWVCPKCGNNVGAIKSTRNRRCQRCDCDLTTHAAIGLQERVEGLDEVTIGAFHQQAMMPMEAGAALYRLGRAALEDVCWPTTGTRHERAPVARSRLFGALIGGGGGALTSGVITFVTYGRHQLDWGLPVVLGVALAAGTFVMLLAMVSGVEK